MLAKYTEDFLNEIYKPGMDVKYADETDLYLELEKARGLSKQIKREHI